MTWRGRIFCALACSFFMLVIISLLIDMRISSSAKGCLYYDINAIPHNRCGLLLGTSKYRAEGGINHYFSARLDAAANLFHSGKIDYIIASGDNSEKNYNEPRLMLQGLKERRVPADRIFPDYAGFRTLDSVIRARKIFNQRSITVISQKFHNARAVYIARSYDIDMIGFNAEDGDDESSYIRVRLREVLARVRAFVDINLTMEKPRFLGDRIDIGQ